MFLFSVALCFFGVYILFDGLLNLGGCGDRIGKKYKKENTIQCIIGFLIVIVSFLLKNIQG